MKLFLFIFPDSLSGVSILFCSENKSLNAAELEKERTFALTDKIKAGDIEKLLKQELESLNSRDKDFSVIDTGAKYTIFIKLDADPNQIVKSIFQVKSKFN